MLDRVCNGRRTKVLTLTAVASAHAMSASTVVQRVRCEKSPRHKRIVTRIKVGSQTSRARSNTLCSKLSLKVCNRLDAAKGDLGSEPIFFDSPIEASAAEPEGLCGMTNVASMARERFADQERFYFFQAHLFDGSCSIPGLKGKVLRPNALGCAHQHCTFDRVIEFAHIPWP